MRFLLIILMLACVPFAARAEGNVFKKVNDAGTLRCGYYVWAPYLIKDPNTGKMSGFYYDLVEELGKQLDLKIEWKEEISWSNLFEGFDTGRIDAFCTPLFVLPSYAKATDFTINIGFEPIHLFVRKDDTRFDKDNAKINAADVTISVMDGEVSQKVADAKFPTAKKLAAPSGSDTTIIAMNVVTKKADVLITNLMLGTEFMKKNPDTLKLLSKEPVQKLPLALPVPAGNYRFKRQLDIGLQALHDNGFISGLADKYYPVREGFINVTPAAE